MDDYITKPVRIEDLQRVLMQWAGTFKESAAESSGEQLVLSKTRYAQHHLSASSLSGVDLAGLIELREMQIGNEPDIVNELVNLFRRDTPQRLAAIRLALAATDFLTAQRETHEIRGSCAELGAYEMSFLSAELEEIEQPAQAERCEDLLTKLETEFVRVRQALNSILVAEAIERT